MECESLDGFQARPDDRDNLVIAATNHVRKRSSYASKVVCDQHAHTFTGRSFHANKPSNYGSFLRWKGPKAQGFGRREHEKKEFRVES